MQDYLIVDGSYYIYFNMFSAWSAYKKELQLENTDEDFDPTNDDVFADIASKKLYSRLSYCINNTIAKYDADSKNVRVIFTTDCRHKKNWRLDIFPMYKASRRVKPKKPAEFNIKKTFDYMQKLIADPNGLFTKTFNIDVLGVDNGEGDDVIAVLVNHIIKDANKIFLLSSDQDFLQLADKVTQLNLFGKEVTIENYCGEALSTKTFTLLKILAGDGSDDIKGVFPAHAIKKCLKLIKNKDALKAKFESDDQYMKTFNMNKSLIDLNLIPVHVTEGIIENYNMVMEAKLQDQYDSLDEL